MGSKRDYAHRLGLQLTGTALCALIGGCLDPDEPGNLVAPTVDDDPTLPAIELAGTRLHAQAFGDPSGPIMMVLHGGPGSDYRALLALRELEDDGYYVVFWDQRGAGLSRRHTADHYSLDAYLEDLRLVIEHYTSMTDQPLVFIGHSWGAMYATWFIDTYGDYGGRVRGAILSEPGGFTWKGVEDYFADFFGSIDFLGEAFNDAQWLDQTITPADHERADYLAMTRFRTIPAEHIDPDNPYPAWRGGAVVNEAMRSLGERANFDWTKNLSEFDHPVLFLRGELNEAMPLEHQQHLASFYDDARVVTIAGVGHEMIWERPEEYLTKARSFIAQLDLGGAQ